MNVFSCIKCANDSRTGPRDNDAKGRKVPTSMPPPRSVTRQLNPRIARSNSRARMDLSAHMDLLLRSWASRALQNGVEVGYGVLGSIKLEHEEKYNCPTFDIFKSII